MFSKKNPHGLLKAHQNYSTIEKNKVSNTSSDKLSFKEGFDCLSLPYKPKRSSDHSYEGRLLQQEVSLKLYQSLKKLAEEQRSDLEMLFFTTFKILLHRYSGQDESITTLISQHNKKNINQQDHILPIITHFNEQLKFTDFLVSIQRTIQKAQSCIIGREQLIEQLGEENYLSHPLNQICFRFVSTEKANSKIENIKRLPLVTETYLYPYELSVTVNEYKNNVKISFLYSTDHFKALTIQKMQKHFLTLLENAVREPEKRISCLDMLTVEERQKILYEWNKTTKDYPRNKTLQQLIEEQVEKTPHNIAAEFEDLKLTYKELNEKSNQLAHHLRKQGVRPDTFVAIACERSLEMIVGILGILKAGAAYVPLDPAFPSERLAYMLEDTKVPIILTHGDLYRKFPKTEASIFLIDNEQELLAIYPTSNPIHLAESHHLAYIIYTSGSTGKPKGVLSTHKGAVNRLLWMKDYCQVDENDCILQKTPTTFDVSVWELLLSFLSGARLVFAKPEGHKDPQYLREIINDKGVTLMHFVPSMLEAFLLPKKIKCPTLQRVITSGEALSYSLKNRFYKCLPHVQLHNLYGPTEASIDVTYWDCSSKKYAGIVPIGKPIWNTSLYILDKWLNPVPRGITGELYLGGEGLAKGYLNKPELTAEKFIENPFVTEEEKAQGKNMHLYKTGDVCRWLNDGNVEYLGRTDHQIKIHGVRIELGEIESAILQHPHVKETIVIIREDIQNDKRLVAYFIAKKKKEREEPALNDYLKNKVPHYMVPTAFVELSEFPLTANGKINRKDLPIPEYKGNEETYVAPRTKTEKELCVIWQGVLKIDKIGIQDNFFELGGHSLLVTQLIFRLNEKFNLSIPLREFFSQPTIENMAAFIEKREPLNTEGDLQRQIKIDIGRHREVIYTHKKSNIPEAPQSILVTGANGFVGIHLIEELIHKTNANIYCLIRAKDKKQAQNRLDETISYYGLKSLKNDPRIIPLAGDFSQAYLGLAKNMFKFLSQTIDYIYHNGAFVHHIFDYAQHRSSNVFSTLELLKLAGFNRPKHLSYISTLSAVFDRDQKNKIFLEQFPKLMPQGIEGGYVISKWVSEKILSKARERGFNVSIYRLPYVLGRMEEGISPMDKNHLMMMLKGCIEMKCAPDIEKEFNVLPVDFAAKVIIQASLSKQSHNKVFNLNHPSSISLKQIFHWLNEFGYPVSIVSYKEWKQKILSLSQESSLFPLLGLYVKNESNSKNKKEEINRYENKNFHNFLSLNKISYPAMDKNQFNIYFNYLSPWLERK
jgi:amino acid adenylation domain-containing protein/thioester reductase-like protein